MKSFLQYSNQSKSLVLVFSLFFIINTNHAQTTVYSNDFGVAENPLASLNAGTPAVTFTNVTSGDGIVKTNIFPTGSNNYALQITNNASTAGRTYTYGGLTTFNDPFQETLSLNTNFIIWTFNIRTSRGATSTGFDGASSNNYGTAVVLCSTSSDFLASNGYAVTLTRGTDKNAVRLVKFTGGLSANTNITTMIGPSPESLSSYTDYYSVKVIYSPTTNKWQLFSRIDGTSIVDPESGTLTQVGTETVDDTYTNTAMSYFGFLFNHQTTTNYYAVYDNFKVVATPNPTTELRFGSQINPIVKSIVGGFSVSAKNASVKVLDTTGKVLASRKINGTYDFTTATKGLYILHITTPNGFDVVKQVVR